MTNPGSPYLSLRQAVRPAILAHALLAADAERAGQLAAECEELLRLTRELLKAAGQERILGDGAVGEHGAGAGPPGVDSAGRAGSLLEDYADAGMAWAQVVGGCLALAGTLLDRVDWEDVRRLAAFLADAGEASAAADLRVRLGRAVWAGYREPLQRIGNTMPPAEIAAAISALRAVLREVPDDFPDRNREVNRLLVPLAASIHAVMKSRRVEIPYSSRVEHIATGGVAKYPDIVKTSLDEIAAEFEGLIR